VEAFLISILTHTQMRNVVNPSTPILATTYFSSLKKYYLNVDASLPLDPGMRRKHSFDKKQLPGICSI